MKSSLDQVLRQYPHRAQPIGPIESLGNAGGESGASLWRFESGIGPLVARAWPLDGPGEELIWWIHHRQTSLKDLPYVPVPVQTTVGLTYVNMLGQFWDLQPWMRGAADAGRPPADARLKAAFAGLAEIHVGLSYNEVDVALGKPSIVSTSAAIQARWDEVESLLAFELDLMKAAVAARRDDSLGKMAEPWLMAARDGLSRLSKRLRLYAAVRVNIQPVLRDVRPDHFLFDGAELTGLVDYGAMAMDTVAIDLARILVEWIGENAVAESIAMAAYEAIRPLRSLERDLLDGAREAAIWLGPARWIRWHFIERRPFANPNAVETGLKRTMSHFDERIRSSGLWLPPE